jgi:hyaluronan synthase
MSLQSALIFVPLTLLLLSPAIIGYIFKIYIPLNIEYAISIYGIYSIVYFLFQLTFAILNRRRIDNLAKACKDTHINLSVGIVITAYRELPVLFTECIKSINASNYKNITSIVCIIDGDSKDDIYLKTLWDSIVHGKNDMCIVRPHSGKRQALYHGFNVLLQNEPDIIITIDSDTILDPDAISELVYQFHADPSHLIGGVAGNVRIWNSSQNLLSLLVTCRYWFAFNVERACDSFFKTVMCISGPLGGYRAEVIKEIKDEWASQTFLGKPCTFGDDRHLTNKVLATGRKVIYTHRAIAYTDTPFTLNTYLRQQIRWSKSWFREFFINIQSITKQSPWMCFQLFYTFTYFFLLMYWYIYLLYWASLRQKTVALLVTLGVGLIRSIYPIIITRNVLFLFSHLYFYVYLFIIFSAKITAILTLNKTGWGTRVKENFSVKNFLYTYSGLIVWWGILLGGLVVTIVGNHEFVYSIDHHYKLSFIAFVSYLGFVLLNLISYYIMNRFGLFSNKLEKNLTN